jgi:hypothetical protein
MSNSRPVHPHDELVVAALANLDIRSYLADAELSRVWTEAGIRNFPTCRNEWEHVTVISAPGEAKAAARHKFWGQFLGVFPLAPEDPVHPYRILYVYKACSPYSRRVERRRALKRILGKRHRPLVTRACRSTKRDFLRTLTRDDARAIGLRLRLDPGRFWRVAKGKEYIVLPTPPRQLTLFDDDPDDQTRTPC